jgi:hypothetical protein
MSAGPNDDRAVDAWLTEALDDRMPTAPLERAVLSRLAAGPDAGSPVLSDVLVAPYPAGAALLGALLLAGAAAYALAPAELDEAEAWLLLLTGGM